VEVGASDASFWVRLSHLAYERMLVDHYTLDQLVEIVHREQRILSVVFITKVSKVSTILHFLFIEGLLIHYDISFIPVH
jgi:hypothetical protein